MFDITFKEPLKDSREAIYEAGLNWSVSKRQLHLPDGSPVPNVFSTVRDDSETPMGVVRGRYQVLQNSEAFNFMDVAMRQTDATYIGAGSFDDGKTIFLTAEISPDPMVISPGDVVRQYITLINNHSGEMRPTAIFSPLRLVCTNMLAMMRRYSSILFSHTKEGIDRMKSAEEKYADMIRVYAEASLYFKYLASKQAKPEDVIEFTEKIYPIAEEIVRPGGIINTREKVIDLFENGKGSDLPSRGSYWNLYNAHVEYLDHYHGRNSTRAKSAMLGASANKKRESFQLAMDMAKKAA